MQYKPILRMGHVLWHKIPAVFLTVSLLMWHLHSQFLCLRCQHFHRLHPEALVIIVTDTKYVIVQTSSNNSFVLFNSLLLRTNLEIFRK